MRRTLPFSLSALAMVLVAACGGSAGGDDDMGEAQQVATDVANPECYIAGGTPEEIAERASPLRQLEMSIGGHAALMCYGAPSANGREIMGALLTYGGPERIGANEPTTIHLTAPTNVGGVALEPGSYSLYAIAGEDEWEFFLNSDYQRWGIPISAEVRASEVGSFTSTPDLNDEMVEQLRYSWEPIGDGAMGNIVLEWEHTRLAFHVMAIG